MERDLGEGIINQLILNSPPPIPELIYFSIKPMFSIFYKR